MKKTLKWFETLLSSMGNAFFHPYRDNAPPHMDPIPFKDDPCKKGLFNY